MNYYILSSQAHPLDPLVARLLGTAGIQPDILAIPDTHEHVRELLHGRSSGVVFIPAMWEDLLCVKIVNEIENLAIPFEAVVAGDAPPVPLLITAFNSGLGAFIETTVDQSELNLILKRVAARLREKEDRAETMAQLERYRSDRPSLDLSRESLARDQLLGLAFTHFAANEGPFSDGSVRILLVSSSQSQQKHLAGLLRRFGALVETSERMEDSIRRVQEEDFTMIITDGILPDGDAIAFSRRLRQELKKRIPHFIVWSASRDKVATLMRPESQINDVILKPSPDVGMESVLPAIIAAAYRVCA